MTTKKNKTAQTPGPEEEALRRPRAPRQRMLAGAVEGSPPADAVFAVDESEGDNQFVGAVARALAVLNVFRADDRALGNSELAERTGLTKPTVSRLAYTLARCGYLSFNPRYRVYELGPSALALGHIALSTIDVRQLARPLMKELASQADFNVGLGTRDQHMMVYTEACEGEALVGLRLFAGSRLPIVTSAMGRAYLAGLEPGEREALLTEIRPLYGDEWQGLARSVEKAVADVRNHGFCVSAGDWQKDIHGVAAPIRQPGGGRVYAINLGGPAYLLPEKALRADLGPRIAEVARKIEAAMTPKATPLPSTPRRQKKAAAISGKAD